MTYQANELEGNLFADNNSEIIGKGKIMIDGQPVYATVIKTTMRDGTELIEFLTSAGRLYVNDNKETPKHPDMGGSLEIKGVPYRGSGWQKSASNGSDYISVSLTRKDEQAPF